MDTLQNMRVFVRVVEAGSFTGAAQHLNTTTAYCSRAVSDLEADQAEAEASDAHARPSGKLKVHAMTSFGQHYVVPAVGRYQKRYPDVHVELTLAQRMPDLLDEGYDVSLTLATGLPDSGLVSQRLGSAFSIACASPAYLEHHGVPQVPSDLANHTCLQMVTPVFPSDEWIFDGPNGQESVFLGPATFVGRIHARRTAGDARHRSGRTAQIRAHLSAHVAVHRAVRQPRRRDGTAPAVRRPDDATRAAAVSACYRLVASQHFLTSSRRSFC